MRTSIYFPQYDSTELYFEMVHELLTVIDSCPEIKLEVKYDVYHEVIHIFFSHPEPEQSNFLQGLVLLYCPNYNWQF